MHTEKHHDGVGHKREPYLFHCYAVNDTKYAVNSYFNGVLIYWRTSACNQIPFTII